MKHLVYRLVAVAAPIAAFLAVAAPYIRMH